MMKSGRINEMINSKLFSKLRKNFTLLFFLLLILGTYPTYSNSKYNSDLITKIKKSD